MKKTFSRWLTALLVCLLLCPLLAQTAYAADASFSGAASLRAGNSVTVTFSLDGSTLLAVDANLRYDSDVLELMGVRQLLGDSWDMQQHGNKFLLYDTAQTNPINSKVDLFSVTFRVKSDAEAGDSVSASISGTASDGSQETPFSASWSASIKAPLSSDAALTDLRCGNAKLQFTGAAEYYITVPHSVSTLDLDWNCSHSAATVAVSGNKLGVGANTVTVTVTAENGNVKRYYIYATRQPEPTDRPSTDARLKSLTLSAGTLSPAFDPDITAYTVYLPAETERLELMGVARDSKAQGVRQVGDGTLTDSETLLLLRCTAEDGITTQDYTIRAIRMPAHTDTPPVSTPPSEPTTPTPPTTPEPDLVPEPQISLPIIAQSKLRWMAVLSLLLVLLGLLFWMLSRRSGRKKTPRPAAEDSSAAPMLTPEAPIETAAPPEDPERMSLDDLLEDIRNM